MAAITTNGPIEGRLAIGGAEELWAAFTEYKQELTWLAEFLTDDELMASACVADARNFTNNNDGICQECIQRWPQEAIIRSALDLKRTRMAELSSAYECEDLAGQQLPPLSSESIERVVRESDLIRRQLDSLCRFALVLCGIEQHSFYAVARVLGVSKHAVEAAYSRALEFLEVIYCQEVLDSCAFATA